MFENRRAVVKDLLWVLALAGGMAAVLRFAFGLGSTTGLNDASPWGLWIAFKLGFVALAGGGFTLAALVYIFHREDDRPVLRRAILLALLGYGSFIVSLLFDLGLPWHIYMPVISWQPHSVMFEIAWCVMLYFSVLVMEFGPVILEHAWFRHPVFQYLAHGLHRLTLPLVIAGIVLSTLHQSSLGALFLIMPHRVHPLWYSPLIPVLFFTSAIGVGLMALVLESFIAGRLFGQPLSPRLLDRLARLGGVALWIYLIIRVGDLIWREVLPSALGEDWAGLLFLVEILLGGALPACLLMVGRIRRSREGLVTSALLAVGGVLSQRMALSLFTMWRPEGASYTPSGLEVIIAFAIPAAAGLIYFALTENLAVFGEADTQPAHDSYAQPQFDWSTLVLQDRSAWSAIIRRSGIGVFVLALTLATFPPNLKPGDSLQSRPIQEAKGWGVMLISGELISNPVLFPHQDHQNRLLDQYNHQEGACKECHHLAKPGDQYTACWECHQDLYLATSIFDHNNHTAALGENTSCEECHLGEHTRHSWRACSGCHDDMALGVDGSPFSYQAPGYRDAMHGACLDCHERGAEELERPQLGYCSTCHQTEAPEDIQRADLYPHQGG